MALALSPLRYFFTASLRMCLGSFFMNTSDKKIDVHEVEPYGYSIVKELLCYRCTGTSCCYRCTGICHLGFRPDLARLDRNFEMLMTVILR